MTAQPAISIIGEEHYRRLERMYLAAPINEFFKPAIQIGRGTAEITVHVETADFFHAARARPWRGLFQEPGRRGVLCRELSGGRPFCSNQQL